MCPKIKSFVRYMVCMYFPRLRSLSFHPLHRTKVVNFNEIQFIRFSFLISVSKSENSLPIPRSQRFCLFSQNFCDFVFKLTIPFQLVFEEGLSSTSRGGGLVWLLPEDVRFLLHHLLQMPSFLYSVAFVSLSVITCECFHYKL